MPGIIILIVFVVYFCTLYLISHLVSKKSSDNEAFFSGNKKSPWYIVAIGMIGTSISGVTFISVPGMVGKFDMTYMQMVFGFFFGYLIVAYVLLPLYYRLNLISIYTYLERRFGFWSYKTGASFFILSRIIGSAAKLYLIALVLQSLIFDHWHIPFPVTVSSIILFIWLYTRKSGIKTIIWTDTLQTICVVIAAILIIWQVASLLHLNISQTVEVIKQNPHSRIFSFDWASSQNFFKQFLSGIFIVIVMTGLDQDIMQKNLTCKNLSDARKNMLTYGFMFIPINLIFLSLGILLLYFASQQGINLPAISDEILPFLVSNYLGMGCLIFFSIGIIGASFANADSALASLTTSFCIDILGTEKQDKLVSNKIRRKVHLGISFVFIITILLIHYIGQENILNTIYKVASYTYGPLLGMFTLGLFTKVQVKDKYTPIVCILAPIICYFTEVSLEYFLNYKVGYEILILNGVLTILGMLTIKKQNNISKVNE
ncbi:sodium:solute symporter [Dysgonomonas macrotermitis]|uniref:Na+/proline symporter n=1 Tax=Dysgonomonas macrotermitis TaxID=1346286 RepID=A0A1M5H4Q8_9BACT|nr:sodium:solute symporter [Dysgonomonas macrotermitis]SHG10989.1 Na+/proline symporter [Dysgonomonas macrotermitis]